MLKIYNSLFFILVYNSLFSLEQYVKDKEFSALYVLKRFLSLLTLNILLSFTQFKRKVTSKRIRNKFEVLSKKGLWNTSATHYILK